jgi:hypothetical protein
MEHTVYAAVQVAVLRPRTGVSLVTWFSLVLGCSAVQGAAYELS